MLMRNQVPLGLIVLMLMVFIVAAILLRRVS